MLASTRHQLTRNESALKLVGGALVTFLGIWAIVAAVSAFSGDGRVADAVQELPQTQEASFSASLWALAETPKDLVAQSDAVILARVEKTDLQVEPRELMSGSHAFGSQDATLSVSQVLKDDKAAPLREGQQLVVAQFAHVFAGELLKYDLNTPLEEGRTYLLFLTRTPDSPERLTVGDPFIQQVIDGRLYWSGARAHLAPNQTERVIGYDPDDPIMAFWDVPVADATRQIKEIAAAP